MILFIFWVTGFGIFILCMICKGRVVKTDFTNVVFPIRLSQKAFQLFSLVCNLLMMMLNSSVFGLWWNIENPRYFPMLLEACMPSVFEIEQDKTWEMSREQCSLDLEGLKMSPLAFTNLFRTIDIVFAFLIVARLNRKISLANRTWENNGPSLLCCIGVQLLFSLS